MHEANIASLENDLKVNCWSNQFETETKLSFFYEHIDTNLILIIYLILDKVSEAEREH